MDLIALADFVAVVRHGGFGPASRATGQPKATLSRRVRALEIELGVRLIERGSRNLRLSEEGEALHRRAAHLVGELAEIGDELVCASQAPRGRLRVSVPAALAGPMLGSLAARFVAAYPDVSVEIVAEDRFVDLVADGFDIVVRANPAPDSALVGQCIRRSYEVVAAHPDMPLPPMSNEPVPVPAAMHVGVPDGVTWRIEREDGPRLLRPEARVRGSSIALLRGAVLAGVGAGVFPRHVIAADLASGALVAWGRMPGGGTELWALHASRRLVSAKVRLFVGALREAFADGPDTGRS